MLRLTAVLWRRGKPRPPAKAFPFRFGRIPRARRPHQGGQQYFEDFMLASLNENAACASRTTANTMDGTATRLPDIRSPLADFTERGLARAISSDPSNNNKSLPESDDGYTSQRSYNEMYEAEVAAVAAPTGRSLSTQGAPPQSAAAALPASVESDDDFKKKFGYSLLKKHAAEGERPESFYSQLDLWAEQPKYSRDTYFLYLVARRRNAYAVIYDYSGKRMLPTYSVGNRGLKKSDKGFRSDGSAENAHIVTSQYLNDVLPKIYEQEIAAGRMRPGERKKIDLVVRILGFYNARAGSIRAVTDKQDVFSVRTLEDITPFPLNGPRMPKKRLIN